MGVGQDRNVPGLLRAAHRADALLKALLRLGGGLNFSPLAPGVIRQRQRLSGNGGLNLALGVLVDLAAAGAGVVLVIALLLAGGSLRVGLHHGMGVSLGSLDGDGIAARAECDVVIVGIIAILGINDEIDLQIASGAIIDCALECHQLGVSGRGVTRALIAKSRIVNLCQFGPRSVNALQRGGKIVCQFAGTSYKSQTSRNLQRELHAVQSVDRPHFDGVGDRFTR